LGVARKLDIDQYVVAWHVGVGDITSKSDRQLQSFICREARLLFSRVIKPEPIKENKLEKEMSEGRNFKERDTKFNRALLLAI
jgi:hypothetical protein